MNYDARLFACWPVSNEIIAAPFFGMTNDHAVFPIDPAGQCVVHGIRMRNEGRMKLKIALTPSGCDQIIFEYLTLDFSPAGPDLEEFDFLMDQACFELALSKASKEVT